MKFIGKKSKFCYPIFDQSSRARSKTLLAKFWGTTLHLIFFMILIAYSIAWAFIFGARGVRRIVSVLCM